jgi:hypothetical protein
MAAIGSVLGGLWPGILGAIMTGLVIYLSLRRVRPRRRLSVLQWRAELDEPIRQERGRVNRPLEG